MGRRMEVAAAEAEREEQGDAPSRALALLLAGETEAGLALYDTCLRGRNPHRLPVGLHLLFLERAGRSEAAERLRGIALRRGANLSVKHVSLGATPAEVVEDYASLFGRGVGNSRMVYEYLVTLSRLGRMDEVAAILAPDRLVRTIRLDLPGPNGRAGGLAAAVQALLSREESQAADRDAVQPLSKVRMLEQLHRLDDPAARALVAALREQADLYLRDWAASDHPLAHFVSLGFDLKAWALFARQGAFSERHVHPNGWATGVYYPADLPGEGAGGELVIGPPHDVEALGRDWPRATIRPEAGLLVLMPSYCMHWTMPLDGPGMRTSVAFDLLDKKPRAQDSADGPPCRPEEEAT
jgi:hypothetical protein